jgi:acyl-homoserine lactone acylase PvdQ
MRILQGKKDFTLDGLETAAYDSYLPWFIKPLSSLIRDWNDLPQDSAMKSSLAAQIAELQRWDLRWGVDSVATSLAIFWAQEIAGAGLGHDDFAAPSLAPDAALQALARASDKLTADFGTWRIPWGQINRYQRVTGDIVQNFNDTKPSTPVGFTSSTFGSLAAFSAKAYPGTKRWYGTKGNSFVAVVEFGDKVRARAVNVGGESGHPQSRHFNDQIDRYRTGNLRDVYFYPEQLKGHTERTYHPGGF